MYTNPQGHARPRREYRGGSSKRPVLDQSMVYGWVSQYYNAIRDVPAHVCDAVRSKYESRVNVYGYSLHELMSLTMTPFLEDHILPELRPEYGKSG